MLKGLNPLLGPDLLRTLRAMGHGDEIAIVDGNYPAETDARRILRMDGNNAVEILDAILSVLPVDDFVPEAVFRPAVQGDIKRIKVFVGGFRIHLDDQAVRPVTPPSAAHRHIVEFHAFNLDRRRLLAADLDARRDRIDDVMRKAEVQHQLVALNGGAIAGPGDFHRLGEAGRNPLHHARHQRLRHDLPRAYRVLRVAANSVDC